MMIFHTINIKLGCPYAQKQNGKHDDWNKEDRQFEFTMTKARIVNEVHMFLF
tara:strand:- start:33 stop:188 length:156 start_codon:yes stop_codon:yes gene_type:complete